MLDPKSDKALHSLNEILGQIARSFLNAQSLLVLVLSVTSALLLGRIIAVLLRKVVVMIGRAADKTENLHTVNRLRRFETMIVLGIALVRTGLLLFAFYFWWVFVHPNGQPTAVIGASAVAVVVIGATLGPILRDLASGSVMMAEQWYAVGDHVRLEPFADMQGVVERVTLRSTRVRGLNGEIIWVNNQHIQGARIAPRGIRTIGLELFVTDLEAGKRLVDMANKRLPIGQLLVVTALQVVSAEEVGEKLWHITAIAETAPGREWLIENSAVQLIKELDEKSLTPIISHGPLARYADVDAERRFKRTIHNASKRPTTRRAMTKAGRAKQAKK